LQRKIKNLDIIQPGNNCRKFRANGAEILKKSILEQGWTPNSKIICSLNEDGTYKLIDGRHRIEAIKSLTEEQRKIIFPNGVTVSVYRQLSDEEELAVSLAANTSVGTIVKTTFFDKMYALQKGRDIVIRTPSSSLVNSKNEIIQTKLAQQMVDRSLSLGMNATTTRVGLSVLILCENDLCWNYLEGIYANVEDKDELNEKDCLGYSAVTKAPIKEDVCFKNHIFFKYFLERLVKFYYDNHNTPATLQEVTEIAETMKLCWEELNKIKTYCATKGISLARPEIDTLMDKLCLGEYDNDVSAGTGITTCPGRIGRVLNKITTEMANTANEPTQPVSSIISTPVATKQAQTPISQQRPITNITPASTKQPGIAIAQPVGSNVQAVHQWDVDEFGREEVIRDEIISNLEVGYHSQDQDEESAQLTAQIMAQQNLVAIANSPLLRKSLITNLHSSIDEVELHVSTRWKFHHMSCDNFFIKYRDHLQDKVKLLYCDPPYNVLKSDRDFISETSMAKIVEYASHWLRPNGVFFVYCSWQQAKTWSDLMQNKGLIVEKALMTINYHSKVRRLTNAGGIIQNAAQYAVVCHKPSQFAFSFNWKGNQKFIKGKHSRGCNVITGYTPPYLKLRNNENKVLVPEQKSVALSQEIISRFASPGNIVVDLFGGSGSSCIAAMKSGLRFFGCERDKEIYTFAHIEICNMYKHFTRHSLFESAQDLETCNVELESSGEDIIGYNCEDKYLDFISVNGADFEDECLEMMAKDFKVYIAPSKIHGRGVFAKENLVKDTVVGFYWGEVIGDATYEIRMAMGRDKMMKTSFNLNDEENTSIYIDGFDWSVGSFFNSSGGKNPNPPNAIYHEDIKGARSIENRPGRYFISRTGALDERMISIVLTDDVEKDTEITVHYGTTYDLEEAREHNPKTIEEIYQASQTTVNSFQLGDINEDEEALGNIRRKRKANQPASSKSKRLEFTGEQKDTESESSEDFGGRGQIGIQNIREDYTEG
jgi:DNA modification methylase